MTALSLLFASGLAALGGPGDWHALAFRSIPPLRHDIARGAITLTVDRSAGGLVRRLPAGTRVKRMVVTGRVEGALKLDEDRIWQTGQDDAFLRVGVIEEGGRCLSLLERLAAPGWVKTMNDVLCVDGRAPAAIHSHLLVPHASWLGRRRPNPKMKQLVDTMSATPGAGGRFTMTVSFKQPLDALGLWLMADGDDSSSSFRVVVESIQLEAP